MVDISKGISYLNANAPKALDFGNDVNKMDGNDVRKCAFRKADKIKQMEEKVMVGKEELVIEPNPLFQRLLILTKNSDINLPMFLNMSFLCMLHLYSKGITSYDIQIIKKILLTILQNFIRQKIKINLALKNLN